MTTDSADAHRPRKRITRKAIARHIADAPLPDDVRNVIHYITFRTRLKKHEQRDVADELIAHFADGIDDGQSPDELIASFGDAKQAAKLIRRGKIRQRSALWHMFFWTRRVVAAFLIIYLLLGVRFLMAQPVIKVDYIAQQDAASLAIPESQRAWPLYQQARAVFDADPLSIELDIDIPDMDDPRWPAWLMRHKDTLELVRKASQRKYLGFIHDDIALQRIYPELEIPSWLKLAGFNAIDEIRRLSLQLSLDNRLALHQNDTDRFVANCQALIGMTGQLANTTLIGQFVRIGTMTVVVHDYQRMLYSRADFLNDDQLRTVSETISKPNSANELVSIEGEFVIFQDILQHFYSDDGKGNGRLTFQAWTTDSSLRPASSWTEVIKGIAIGPIVTTTTGSRQKYNRRFDNLMTEMKIHLDKPFRDAPYKYEMPSFAKDLRWFSDAMAPTFTLAESSIQNLHRLCEVFLGQRDGLAIGIGLELYRRVNGEYPKQLQALVPDYLPELPIDRINGLPLHYAIIENLPIVYSVGADGDDDGGRIPAVKGSVESRILAAAKWDTASAETIDGDWILWPPAEFFMKQESAE